jgi:hypothetical protein
LEKALAIVIEIRRCPETAPIPSDGRSLSRSHGRGFEYNAAGETQLASGTTMLKFVRDALPRLTVKAFPFASETDGQIWIGGKQSHALQLNRLNENAVSCVSKVAPSEIRNQIR